ncbi:DUF222 domain-containing protein [Microbacterium sp. NPDC057407]|uniref:HNH endonuclease signature motif containing protein n=1 Tax=Microbacterium sp. NPDC057407 TaxID=3346120 RepID=UPI00366FF92B
MLAPDPDTLDPDVEELLWAERMAIADSWDEPAEHAPVALAVPAAEYRHRWDVAASRREELLFEWENAAEQLARWQGVQVRLLAEALELALEDGTRRDDAALSVRSAAAELACAVGLADRTVEQRMNDALVMRDRFPQTMEALASGRLSLPHARVVADGGARLDSDDARAWYETAVLDRATGLTTGRLRVVAASIAEEAMPTSIAERHVQARGARRVTVRDVEDGMSELWALLPSVLAHGIHDRLTRIAKPPSASADEMDLSATREGSSSTRIGSEQSPSDAPHDVLDDRTTDQRRADALCDLLLTGLPTIADIDRHGGEGVDALRAVVQVTVPFESLVGDAGPAPVLAGRSPIDPATARRLLGAATLWDRVLTDPVTGDVLAVDRRFPTEAQRRHLRARDEHCRFPGCRMPVWRSDVDHTVDHQHGGPTAAENLAHLCRRHHTLKHHTAWQVRQDPGGVLEWTSPLGRTYIDRPPPRTRFVPAHHRPPCGRSAAGAPSSG